MALQRISLNVNNAQNETVYYHKLILVHSESLFKIQIHFLGIGLYCQSTYRLHTPCLDTWTPNYSFRQKNI